MQIFDDFLNEFNNEQILSHLNDSQNFNWYFFPNVQTEAVPTSIYVSGFRHLFYRQGKQMSDYFYTITPIISEIEKNNSDRKELDKQITIEALSQIEQNNETEGFTTVVYQENWHKGVIGIVASRIIEHHYRPTIILGFSDGKISGSARSIKGFDIHEALIECSDLLLQFGGHTHAAGLSMLPENLSLFIDKFDEISSRSLTRDMLQPVINYDLKIGAGEITPSLVKLLKQFEL